LTADDKLGNLNLAFDVAKEHLDVARILDAEDIVNMPRPDERSIMTYVAQLYKVFSSLDKVETAGRRVGKFVGFNKAINEMIAEYERRTTALNKSVNARTSQMNSDPVGNDYASAKGHIQGFKDYKRNERRQWVGEQADLVTLFSNIQAKQKSFGQSPYVAPGGLAPSDVSQNFSGLYASESKRRTALNSNMRNILEELRKGFANLANPYYESLTALKSSLSKEDGSLEDQLAFFNNQVGKLSSLSQQLSGVSSAEQKCNNANIEDNEYTEHSYDDLDFETSQLQKAFQKKVIYLESEIAAASENRNVTPQQMQEFKESFNHFDSQKAGKLSRLDFKSCLSGLGVVELDFEGGNAVFESIFKRVSEGAETVSFDQFVDYMISITVDSVSKQQLSDSFEVIAGGKDHITVNDMKVAQLTADQIQYLTSVMPAHGSIADAYNFRAWLAKQF
jgi:Ca2+-binding EF-hand superfamily protein